MLGASEISQKEFKGWMLEGSIWGFSNSISLTTLLHSALKLQATWLLFEKTLINTEKRKNVNINTKETTKKHKTV